jgi:hypothetical protein
MQSGYDFFCSTCTRESTFHLEGTVSATPGHVRIHGKWYGQAYKAKNRGGDPFWYEASADGAATDDLPAKLDMTGGFQLITAVGETAIDEEGKFHFKKTDTGWVVAGTATSLYGLAHLSGEINASTMGIVMQKSPTSPERAAATRAARTANRARVDADRKTALSSPAASSPTAPRSAAANGAPKARLGQPAKAGAAGGAAAGAKSRTSSECAGTLSLHEALERIKRHHHSSIKGGDSAAAFKTAARFMKAAGGAIAAAAAAKDPPMGRVFHVMPAFDVADFT